VISLKEEIDKNSCINTSIKVKDKIKLSYTERFMDFIHIMEILEMLY
jgi:hypothetical protein